jgi:hypothetical protein
MLNVLLYQVFLTVEPYDKPITLETSVKLKGFTESRTPHSATAVKRLTARCNFASAICQLNLQLAAQRNEECCQGTLTREKRRQDLDLSCH